MFGGSVGNAIQEQHFREICRAPADSARHACDIVFLSIRSGYLNQRFKGAELRLCRASTGQGVRGISGGPHGHSLGPLGTSTWHTHAAANNTIPEGHEEELREACRQVLRAVIADARR
jgi:hypothetical protein